MYCKSLYKQNSIKHITDNGELIYSSKDEGILELESYRYDLKASAKTGKEAYVKENDHNIDATRYLLENWKNQDKCPVV